MGCHYGSRLQQAGNSVRFLARGTHLNALQQHGLLHESEGSSVRLHVEAIDHCADIADADVLILCCKMTALMPMFESLSGKIGAETLLVTLQNGVEAVDWVTTKFPNHAIAAGTAFIGARLEAPGHVIHSAAGSIRLGLWQSGAGDRLLPELIAQFKAGGVPARREAEPALMLWRKLLWNTGFNAITAIHRCFASQICEQPEMLAIARSAMGETVAVAQAEGIKLGEDDIQGHIDVTLSMGPVKTSMWQDIEAGHATEVEYLNGLVVRQGELHGIATPVNRMLVAQVHAIEVA